MQVGDIVKLTNEGHGYVYGQIKNIRYPSGVRCGHSVGLIVKKYPYEEGDDESNGQDVYDVLIAGQVIESLFASELGVV